MIVFIGGEIVDRIDGLEKIGDRLDIFWDKFSGYSPKIYSVRELLIILLNFTSYLIT